VAQAETGGSAEQQVKKVLGWNHVQQTVLPSQPENITVKRYCRSVVTRQQVCQHPHSMACLSHLRMQMLQATLWILGLSVLCLFYRMPCMLQMVTLLKSTFACALQMIDDTLVGCRAMRKQHAAACYKRDSTEP
jgi:hypothetical protein